MPRGKPGSRRKRYCKSCGKDITYDGERGPRGGFRGVEVWYCDDHRYGVSDETGKYGTRGNGVRHDPLTPTA